MADSAADGAQPERQSDPLSEADPCRPDVQAQLHSQLRASVARLLDDVGDFGSRLAHASPAELSDDVNLDDVDKTLSSFFAHGFELRQRLRQHTFVVAVLALAKSGKSTFLNALTGAPLLPVNNIPETARICRITHTPLNGGEEAVLYDKSRGSPADTVVGEEAIRRHLIKLNREVRMRDHQLSDEVLLDMALPIAALADQPAASDGVAFQLLDTPGPNESGEEALRFQVERLLDSVDAVIYLLDYTKLRTSEEASIFERIKQINPGLIKRLSRRLFFVVNKVGNLFIISNMDTIRVSEGLDEDATRKYVAELVTTQLADEGFHLRPEQVLLVSAQEALLSRLVLRQAPAASPETLRRFKERAFGSSRAVQRRTFTPAELQAAAQDMCEDSGMMEVESSVFGFLYSHAGALKLMAIVDDIARTLHQMANAATVSESSLCKSMEKLREEAAAMQKTLEETLSRFDEVQAATGTLEAEVVDEVRTRLGFLRERLVEHVVYVLDAAAAADERSAPAGRWRAVFDKAQAFLGRRAAGADRAELQITLQELHADIFHQVDQEVRGFWHLLETATNERQRALLRRLNAHLEGLSRAIEAVVSERLAVRLEPVDLRLAPPSAQQFHDSLQRLFATGIQPREVTREHTREVEHTVWEKRYRGLCHTAEYYVGVPTTRTVREEYTVTEYEIQIDKIKEYFVDLIGKTINASVRSVRAFVKQYLAVIVATARSGLETYAERFTSCMLTALATSERGEQARVAALEHVRGHQACLAALLAQAFALQAQAEALFPAAAASIERASSLEFDDDDLLPAAEQPEQPGELQPDSAAAVADANVEEAQLPNAEPHTAPVVLPASAAEGAVAEAQPDTAIEAEAAAATVLMHGGEPIECLLCGSEWHQPPACPSKAASSSAHASHGGSVAGGVGSVADGAVGTDAPAAAADAPHSDGEEDLYDAQSNLGGSFCQAAAPEAEPAEAVAAVVPAAAADPRPAAAGEAESSNTDEVTAAAAAATGDDISKDLFAGSPRRKELAASAASASDAFSGASLGTGDWAASSTGRATGHANGAPALVPAHSAADIRSQLEVANDAGAPGGSIFGDEAANGDLATIPLAGGGGGNSAPTSPSAASAASDASSSADDWTVVDNEHELEQGPDAQQAALAAARRRLAEQ